MCCSLSLKKYKINLRSQRKIASSDSLLQKVFAFASGKYLEALPGLKHFKANSLLEVLDHPGDEYFGCEYICRPICLFPLCFEGISPLGS